MKGDILSMSREKNGSKPSKMFLMWIPVLFIILIKSNIVLFILYQIDTTIIIYNVYNLTPILFLISFSFLFSRKGQLFYLFGLSLFISVLFVVDIIYSRAYGHLISIYMIFAKVVSEDLSASALSLIKWTDFLMFLDLPFLFILAIKSKAGDRVKKRIFLFYFTIVFSAAAICFQFVQLEQRNILGNYNSQLLLMSPIGYHMFDIYRFAYERTYKLNNEDIVAVDDWMEKNAKYQIPKEDYAYLGGSIKGKNIIAIQIESLENIVVGLTNNGQEITPNINKLLGSSIYFKHIHEQVRDGNSSDAELLFNTSLYPISNGSSFLRFGENTYNDCNPKS